MRKSITVDKKPRDTSVNRQLDISKNFLKKQAEQDQQILSKLLKHQIKH